MAMEESDDNMQSYSWADVEVAEVRNRVFLHLMNARIAGRSQTTGRHPTTAGPLLPTDSTSCQWCAICEAFGCRAASLG